MRIKIAVLCLIIVLAFAMTTACSQPASGYKDGFYTAQSAEFASSGWKDTMEVTIEGGKITKINWDAIYKNDSIPIRKKQYSKSGLYGMLAAGAVGEWYDQAIAAEKYVLENGVDVLVLDEGGYTDAISGCTVHVNEFERLIRECLDQAAK